MSKDSLSGQNRRVIGTPEWATFPMAAIVQVGLEKGAAYYVRCEGRDRWVTAFYLRHFTEFVENRRAHV